MHFNYQYIISQRRKMSKKEDKTVEEDTKTGSNKGFFHYFNSQKFIGRGVTANNGNLNSHRRATSNGNRKGSLKTYNNNDKISSIAEENNNNEMNKNKNKGN